MLLTGPVQRSLLLLGCGLQKYNKKDKYNLQGKENPWLPKAADERQPVPQKRKGYPWDSRNLGWVAGYKDCIHLSKLQ